MESLAKPGTVLVSKNTYKMVHEYFQFNDLGEIDVKGKDILQKAYGLIKTSKIETRLDASAAKGLTQFVGRKNSMTLLQTALKKAKSGLGQVVGIIGEAGVGKSRLILEFQNNLSTEQHTYLEGSCIHFGGSMAYLPFLDIIKSYFDISDDDREFVIKKKIQEKVLGFEQTLTKAIPAIHDLLSLQVDDELYGLLDPPSKRERTFEAIRDILLFESQKNPLILVVEDLHWIDKTSEDFINYLIGWLANSPIMLIFLYRPEYTHQWGSKSYYTKIGLDQLGKESSIQLLEAILKGDVVPELSELILNRTTGNPLFMEELTNSLLENGSIKQENDKYIISDSATNIKIPETLQGIIAARMDRLEDNLKRTMQVASVIGRDFAFRILNTITDMRKDLKSYLLNLQGLEFIYEKSLFPELEYIFKHALIQEVAYNSLLQNRRKEIHEKIGNAIETIYADRLEEFYEMLAYHYIKSDNLEKGATYSKLASKKANKDGSFMEAISFAIQNVSCIEKLPKNDEMKINLIDARTFLGLYYNASNYHIEAKEAIDPIIDLAINLNYKKRLAPIYLILGSNYLFNQENYSNAIKYLELALKTAKETSDFVTFPNAYMYLGNAFSFNCYFEKAQECYNNAIKFCQDVSSDFGIAVFKSALSFLVYGFKGDIDKEYQISLEAVELAEKSNNAFGKGMAYSGYGFACYYKGLFEGAIKAFKKAIEHNERANHVAWASVAAFGLAKTYYEIKDYTNSKLLYELSCRYMENNRMMASFVNVMKVGIVKSKIMSNEELTKQDLQYLNVTEYGFNIYEGWVLRFSAEVYMKLGDSHLEKAENLVTRAIEADKKYHIKINLAKDYALYAKLLKHRTDNQNAQEYLKKALATFKECGANSWAEKTEKDFTTT